MAITASIILDTRRKTAKGFPIKIRLRPKYIHLNEYAEIEQWENDNVNKLHPDFRRLHLKLNRRKLQLLDELRYINENNLDVDGAFEVISQGLQSKDLEIFTLKQRIKQLQRSGSVGLLEFFDVRIDEKKQLNENYSVYQNVRKRFDNYLMGNDVDLNEITYEWLNEFVNYKLKNGAKRGGVNSYLKTLRAIYNEAKKRGSLNVKQGNPFIGFIKPAERREVIRLLPSDFEKIMNFYLAEDTKPTQRRTIALWLFQLVIGGHDVVDTAVLEWKQIKNGRIRFKRYKNRSKGTGGSWVDNKLLPLALEVIERYGISKKARVFDFIPDPRKDLKRYEQYSNNLTTKLNVISEKIELSTQIKGKSPRYLFRSKAGELLVHDLIVMELMGHKPKDVTFAYQAALPNSIKDEAHERIVNAILKV